MPTNEIPTRSTRLPIDPLRGYVCLGVVGQHLYNAAFNAQLKDQFGSVGDFAQAYLCLGVEAFFVLAGFFLAHMIRPSAANYVSVPRLAARRLLRLAIPYWCTIALVLLAALVGNAALGRQNVFSTGHVFAAVFFIQDVFGNKFSILYPLWSMATLIQFYVATLVAYWVIRRVLIPVVPESYPAATRRVMIGIGFFVLFFSPLAARPGVLDNAEWQLPGWVGILTLGAITYWRGERFIGAWAFVAVIAFHVALAVYLENGRYGKSAACAVLLVLIQRGLTIPDCWVTRALAAVGCWSYSIYLVHGFIGLRIVNWSVYMSSEDRDQPVVVLGLLTAGLVASIAAGFLMYRFVERPVALRAARIRYRR